MTVRFRTSFDPALFCIKFAMACLVAVMVCEAYVIGVVVR